MYRVDYTIIPNSVNLELISEELDAATTIPDPVSIAFAKDGGTLYIYFEADLTPEELTTLNDLVSMHDPETLEEAKKRKCKEIDDHTTELVADGFEFGGIVFSGSIEAQSRVIGAYTARAFATYPIRWMSKDDTTYLDIVDEDMLTAFFLTGFSTLKAKIDLGSNLKTQVASAISVEEVNSIIDPR